jgi:hypothetical protein
MSHTYLPRSAALVASFALVGIFAGCSGCTGGGNSGASAPSGSAPSTAAAPAASGAAAGATGQASISGTVKLDGAPPEAMIDMSSTAECGAQHPPEGKMKSEKFVVKDGKLANAIVFVESGLAGGYSAPTTPNHLDQKGCAYGPHVSVMMTNQPLEISNSDPVTHNVHAEPKENDPFNAGQPPAAKDTKKFKKPEIVKFKCDVHNWMSAYIGVFDHPYATVTDADGNFKLPNLPAGTYTIKCWHEAFPKGMTQTVTLGATDSKTGVDFTFKLAQ